MSRSQDQTRIGARRAAYTSAKKSLNFWRLSFAGIPKGKAAGPGRGVAAYEKTKQPGKHSTGGQS